MESVGEGVTSVEPGWSHVYNPSETLHPLLRSLFYMLRPSGFMVEALLFSNVFLQVSPFIFRVCVFLCVFVCDCDCV